MDFSKSYVSAAKEALPHAKIIFDKFHMVKILHKYMTEDRKKIRKKLENQLKLPLSKQSARWTFYKRYPNLTPADKEYLELLKKENEPEYELYLLKEEFINIFVPEYTRQEGLKKIKEWVSLVFKTPFKNLQNFGIRILLQIDRILNWFDFHVSNATAEGINNVISTLLKSAYGYKDLNYLRLKILQKCGYLMPFNP